MAGKGIYYESQFEEATIELLREAHWQYTFGDDIHRKYTDPLIEEDLRNFLAAQYKDRDLTTSEIDGIVANLRNTGGQNDYYALRNAFLLYRDGYDFAYSDGRDNPCRYYDPKTGNYISQDPIGLAGGNPTLYGYVFDPNTQIDPLGLECGYNKKKLPELPDTFAREFETLRIKKIKKRS